MWILNTFFLHVDLDFWICLHWIRRPLSHRRSAQPTSEVTMHGGIGLFGVFLFDVVMFLLPKRESGNEPRNCHPKRGPDNVFQKGVALTMEKTVG
jgi:hypothetical protein